MIKRLDPKAILRLVSTTDEAIDLEKSDIKKYVETLNMKHLTFKDGESPTIFLVQNISAPKRAEISEEHYTFIPGSKDPATGVETAPTMDMKHQAVMLVKYFEYGIKAIEEDGKAIKVHVDEFSQAIVQELGAYVMMRSAMGDTEKK